MKVAIITITDGVNYGNRLQNYALQEILHNMGCEVKTLKRRTSRDLVGLSKINRHLKDFAKLCLGRPHGKARQLRQRAFKTFNEKYILFSDPMLHDNIAPTNLNEQYDYFVVGSDQVWNAGFRIIREDLLNYLAAFADPKKRIAYAASFGTENLAKGTEQLFSRELPKFKYISVREKSGVQLVESCGTNAQVVLDPTMLLSKQQWEMIAKKPTYVEDSPFVLTYFLGGLDEGLCEYINKIANGRAVYKLESEFLQEDLIERREVFATAPDEFVWLIANADCILTDSFHASALSILFHKPFCVLERRPINESYKIGSRIDTLLETFSLTDFKTSLSNPSVIPKQYPTEDVDRILSEKKEASLEFLRKALMSES